MTFDQVLDLARLVVYVVFIVMLVRWLRRDRALVAEARAIVEAYDNTHRESFSEAVARAERPGPPPPTPGGAWNSQPPHGGSA